MLCLWCSNGLLGFGLLEPYLAKAVGTVEIGLLIVDRIPRHIMAMSRLARAFVEIALDNLWWRFSIQAHERKRNRHCQVPAIGAVLLVDRFVAARGITLYRGQLFGSEPCGLVALHAMAAVEGAYAVELKVPVFIVSWHLHEELHAAVVGNGAQVGGVHGAQVFAYHREEDIEPRA